MSILVSTIPSRWVSKMAMKMIMYVVAVGIAVTLIVPVSGLMPHMPLTTTTTMAKSTKYTSLSWMRFHSPHSITTTDTSTGSNVLYSSMKPFNNDKNNQNKTNTKNDNTSTSSSSSIFSSNLITSLSNRFDTTNVIYGVLWIILITLAFTNNPIIPHGDVVDQIDAQLLQSIVENPTHPNQLNELYFFLFNLFAIIPILLASLLLPIHEITMTTIGSSVSRNDSSSSNNNNNQLLQLPSSIPPQPFVLASAAIGYFAMGIYLTLRNPPSRLSSLLSPPPTVTRRNSVAPIFKNLLQQPQRNNNNIQNLNIPLIEEWSWYTKNIWENTIVQWLSVAFIIYLPFGCQTISVLQTSGWDTLYHDFIQLLSSSRFVAISCMDLFLLHITCTSLIPYDYTYRRQYTTTALSSPTSTSSKVRNGRINQDPNVVSSSSSLFDDEQRGRQIATLAAFVPYLGTALYLAVRPSIVIKDDDQ